MATKEARRGKLATYSWMLWDWAEQPYPTIIQTFVFPLYLANEVARPGSNVDAQLGVATIVAGVLLALTAPVIGSRSDSSGRGKFWLMLGTYALVALMVASFFIEPKPEFLLAGLVLYGLGSFVQEATLIHYYAMLKSVTSEKNIGRISGFAWGLGYVGGIILLLISLVAFLLNAPETSVDNGFAWRIVFIFSAVWTLIFSLPVLFFTRSAAKGGDTVRLSIGQSYRELWRKLISLKRQAPETFKFLISSAIYRDGLAGVFTFGAVLGSLAFGFGQIEIMMFGVVANIIAGVGAGIGGWLDDKLGSRTVILASLIGLILAGTGVFVFAGFGQITYWIGGLLLCLFVGPAQASSRTFVSRFTPKGREGEVFGLYQTTGRAVSFLSGTLWTVSISVAHTAFHIEDATIYGIWGLLLILAVGAWLLSRVNPNPAVLEAK